MSDTANFFAARMLPLGLTEENNKIVVKNRDAEFPMPSAQEVEIFTEDKEGNIVILYWRINGDLITWQKIGDGKMSHQNAKTLTYKTRRLKEPKGDTKYLMPRGMGSWPWFSPETTKAYAAKEKIETIYLTEGVFKAWKGCKHGVHVVGLSSITHYANTEGNLHEDIKRLIVDCRVENVVVLWDGDCTDISNKALAKREDLTKRPRGFFNAVKAVDKLVKRLNIPKEQPKPNTYFLHILPESFSDKPKGLDDILISAEREGMTEAVISDLKNLEIGGEYFYKFDLKKGTAALNRHFHLNNAEAFFTAHNQIIGNIDFYFKDDLHRYDDENDELTVIAPGWAQNTFWVGDEFFQETLVPGASRDRRTLLKRDKSTMAALYGKDFLKYLQHFAGFCCLPDHFNYQRVVEIESKRFYNRYFPFRHDAIQGECPTIIGFFKHIFGEVEIQHPQREDKYLSWEMGLDYVQILLNEPSQVLPIVCLFSLENSTGKSTFGKLLAHLLGDNVVQIGNADLQSDFNEVYSDKLLAICEETLLERKKDAERVKALSTSDQITVNPKGQRQFSIDFFCKFMFFSNNRRMIYLTKHDERYWIIQVRKSKTEDVNLLQKMKAEIPAFIYYLRNRELITKRDSRMHFHPSLIRTDSFYDTVKVNEPQAATDLRNGLAEMFLEQKDLKILELPLKEIKQEFFTEKSSTKWVKEILTDYLNVDLKRGKDGKAKYERGKYFRYEWDDDLTNFTKKYINWKGRPYIFHREDFIDDSQTESYVSEEEAKALKEKEEEKQLELKEDTPF